jgi:superfamily II helicase
MAGAKQVRAPCPHIDDRPVPLTFHSIVTENNADKWEREVRIPRGVDEDDLRAVLEYAGDDEVAVCNSCRRIKVNPGEDAEVVHTGDPYNSDRTGEWKVDVHADDEPAFGGDH